MGWLLLSWLLLLLLLLLSLLLLLLLLLLAFCASGFVLVLSEGLAFYCFFSCAATQRTRGRLRCVSADAVGCLLTVKGHQEPDHCVGAPRTSGMGRVTRRYSVCSTGKKK